MPPCPGWTVADLLAHVGYVHRWAARYVTTALTEMVEEPGEAAILSGAPPEADRADWVAEGHRDLVRALRAAPEDLDCWAFLKAPSPLAMWARRQAHETAVHRVDAQLSAGSPPTPVSPAFASDGIDELLFAFFGRRSRRRFEVPGGAVTVALDATDQPGGWTVRVSAEAGVEARHGLGEAAGADVSLRGTAGDLYLALWHRRPAEGLVVEGRPELFEAAWGPRGVTWS